MKRPAILLALLPMALAQAGAQPPAKTKQAIQKTPSKRVPQNVQQMATPLPPTSKLWSVNANINLTSNMSAPSDRQNQMNTAFEAIGRYKIDPDLSLNAYGAVTKDLKNERKTELQNGYVGASAKILRFNDDNGILSGETRVYAPLNKQAREGDGLITRFYGAPSLSHKWGGLSASIKSAFAKSLHEYKQKASGRVNTSHTLGNSISLNYQALEWLSFNTYFLNTHSWDYDGTRRPDQFETGQSASFSVTENFGTTVGHTLGGNSFKSNGIDSNIRLYDRDDSTVYGELNFSF